MLGVISSKVMKVHESYLPPVFVQVTHISIGLGNQGLGHPHSCTSACGRNPRPQGVSSLSGRQELVLVTLSHRVPGISGLNGRAPAHTLLHGRAPCARAVRAQGGDPGRCAPLQGQAWGRGPANPALLPNPHSHPQWECPAASPACRPSAFCPS